MVIAFPIPLNSLNKIQYDAYTFPIIAARLFELLVALLADEE